MVSFAPISVIDSKPFSSLLKCLKEGEEYESEPPSGPPNEFPSLSDQEMDQLRSRLEGSELDRSDYSYDFINLYEGEGEDHKPKKIDLPSSEEVQEKNIYAIDGSNQVVGPSAFKLILARGSLVRFEYRSKKQNKYHRISTKDLNSVFIGEGRIFESDIDIFGDKIEQEKDDDKNQPILNDYEAKESDEPFIVEAGKGTSNPSDEALGWGVKFQQILELSMLGEIPDEKPGVVIRDGPLFSTSASVTDTIQGLNKTQPWKNQVLMSVSKRVGSSTLLIEALENEQKFRDAWFPDQNITEDMVRSLNADSAVLNQLLEPGERTPWLEAVNRQRTEITERDDDYTPLVCYYMTRNQPHSMIRIEVPRFMKKERPEDVELAMKLVAWQNELGKNIPMIQKWADRTCQLKDEKRILDRLVKVEMAKNNLDLQGVLAYD